MLALLLTATPVAVAAPVLNWLGSSEGVAWAYSLYSRNHPLNFGGNPSEVFSHLLNWILMTACTSGLCFTLIAIAILKVDSDGSSRLTIALALGAGLALLVLGWAIALDSRHGEGVVGISFLLLFGPCTMVSAVVSRGVLSGNASLSLKVIFIAAILPLAMILQWFYQPSDSGGPNILAFPLLFGQVAVWWLLGRGFRRQPSLRHEGLNVEPRR